MITGKALQVPGQVWRSTLVALLALSGVWPCGARADTPPGDSWDFTLDTRSADSGISVTQSDSPTFTLDTTGADAAPGGLLQADSSDFLLDTTLADSGLTVLLSDSGNFILDTRAADNGLGLLQSDSPDFALDTTGPDGAPGGLSGSDSPDFILDTRGADAGAGGVLLADSPDFPLDTRDGLDIGLRVYDGLAIIKIAVEAPGPGGQLASALRTMKRGTNYGILLIPTNWPDASRVRIQTAAGTKAWRKLP